MDTANLPESMLENVAIVAAILTPAILESCRAAIQIKGHPLTEDEEAEIRARYVSSWRKMIRTIVPEAGRRSRGPAPSSRGKKILES